MAWFPEALAGLKVREAGVVSIPAGGRWRPNTETGVLIAIAQAAGIAVRVLNPDGTVKWAAGTVYYNGATAALTVIPLTPDVVLENTSTGALEVVYVVLG